MAGFTKNIAVIRGIKDGFSADGGELSGLVKAEKYGQSLTVEITLLNFAPLSEGRYVAALTDGKATEIVEDNYFSGDSAVDTGKGFAALVCYINGGVYPIASAICGNYRDEVFALKGEIEKRENFKAAEKKTEKKPAESDGNAAVYEDEAIAEDNYYEYEADEGGGALREDKKEEESGDKSCENEKAFSSLPQEQSDPADGLIEAETAIYSGGNEETGAMKLAGGAFFEKMKDEVDGILSEHPKEEGLENLIEGSKWVRVAYDENRFYVFGVIYSGGNAQYICYGVPSADSVNPPESMADACSFIPAEVAGNAQYSGFWVMYQDAQTGATLKLTNI